ncbi:response regulator [Salinispira pacifica]
MPKVLLCDDHDIVRRGLRDILEEQPFVRVVGEARDGIGAIGMATELAPDIVIMDISMPLTNGIDAAAEIRKRLPGCRIIFLSVHAGSAFVLRALREGASGYLLKDDAAEEIPAAVHAVSGGRRYFSRQIAGSLKVTQPHGGEFLSAPDGLSMLSVRERQVLQLVAEGMTNQQTAEKLNISIKTVETYRSRLMTKLGIDDYPHLVLFALHHGIVNLEPEAR